MKKFLVIILIFFLGAITFVAMMALTLVKGWSFWAPAIALGIIWAGPLIYLLGKSFWGWLARRGYAKALRLKETSLINNEGFSLLQRQWANGLRALSPKTLRGPIDPVRDLGWFLLLGPANSGKTEAVWESGLINNLRPEATALDAENGREPGGCQWYLFDNSVVLDVKGLVAEPKETEDPAEWATFVELLRSTGRAKPLEGVVLTIPAELLSPQRAEDLRTLVDQDREKLRALAQELDQAAPVYLLLTRLEVMGRLAEGLKLLEASGRPVGILLEPDNKSPAEFVHEALENQLRDLFIEALNSQAPIGLAPILATPESLGDLERALALIMSTLLHKSAQIPAPIIRGVFFSTRVAKEERTASTDRTDRTARPVLGASSTVNASDSNSSSLGALSSLSALTRPQPKGLARSLADFFRRVLPTNRSMTERLNLPSGRRQKIIVTGLLIFYALTFLMILAFRWDVSYNRDVNQIINATEQLSLSNGDNKGAYYLGHVDGLDYVLDQLEALKKHFWFPRLWKTRADWLVEEKRREFFFSFELANLGLTRALSSQVEARKDPASRDYGETLKQLLWLFEVFNAYDQGEPLEELAMTFPFLPQDFQGASASMWSLAYNKSLFDYFRRQPLGLGPKKALEAYKLLIEKCLIDSSPNNFDWFWGWAASVSNTQLVSIAGFWEPFGLKTHDFPLSQNYQISGVYTLAGRESIWRVTKLLNQACQVYPTPIIQARDDKFKAKYDRDYLNHWRHWINQFIAISNKIAPRYLVDIKDEVVEGGSPYVQALDLLDENLSPFYSDEAEIWLKNIELDEAIVNWVAIETNVEQEKSLLSQARAYVKALEFIKQTLPKYYKRPGFLKKILEAKPLARQYQTQSALINSVLDGSPDEALKLAASHYGGSVYAIKDKSPFSEAERALIAYEGLIFASPADQKDLMVSLRKADLEYLKNRFVAKVARRVDALWRSEVVGPTRFLNEEEANKALYSADGLIVKFQKATVAPFLVDSGVRGFRAAQWENRLFPFTDDFLRLLTQGHQPAAELTNKDSYDVTISAVASLVPEAALEKPQRTTLTLKNPDSLQTVDIFNYPISKVFAWKPGLTGDVELAIVFPSLELYLNYSGLNAFASFLRDILKGELVFTPRDFPEHQERLNSLGITEIRVLIKADGALPVIQYMDQKPLPLPNSIVKVS
ncbi:MAG: hypothetical protein LBT86_09355 [Deltaproteobacteria bacterium]|nr:hypothetical protein [Deltaproteobacteria bacterium]